MRLFQRHHTEAIPVVPDDRPEREEAIRRSMQKLAETRASVPNALRVADLIRAHDMRNHYIERIRQGYGVGGI